MSYVTTIPHQPRELGYLPRYMTRTPEGQRFMSDAHRDGLQIRCACSSSLSSPLVARKLADGRMFLARLPNTEHEHSPRCPHGDVASMTGSFGMPHGSLSTKSGQLLIDFDALFPDPPREPARSGGMSHYEAPNHGKHMYSLAMFLLVQAGLMTYGRRNQHVNPWKCFQGFARSIRVAKAQSTLEERMLLPSEVYQQSRNVNFAKLTRAPQKKSTGRVTAGRVLFVSVLPPGKEAWTLGRELALKPSLGVHLTVGPRVLARAWSMFSAAEDHHVLGRPVLAVGMATVQDKRPRGAPTPVIRTRVTQLALIPVGHSLRPTPTSKHWQALQAAVAGVTTYRVEPEEDAFFRAVTAR